MADGYQELTVESLGTTDGISNLCRMINELYNNMGGDGQNVRIFNGYGTPEGVVTAGVGSLYLRKDGTTDTTLYRKETGTGGTGWVAVVNFSLPLSIANGGTGQTTAQDAINALTDVSSATNEYVLTKDTATGNAIFKILTLGLSNVKVGSFSRTGSTASGNVSYTGIGFRPKVILFFANTSATGDGTISNGFDDGSNRFCSLLNIDSSAITQNLVNTSYSIYMYLTAGTTDYQRALIYSFDADGFTLTWTKAGSGSQTQTIGYLAIK